MTYLRYWRSSVRWKQGFVTGGDQVRDKNNAIDFGKEAARRRTPIEISKSNPNQATIIVGEEEWPLPVPLVKKKGKWYFNAKVGRREILYRRIGANELDAITVCAAMSTRKRNTRSSRTTE